MGSIFFIGLAMFCFHGHMKNSVSDVPLENLVSGGASMYLAIRMGFERHVKKSLDEVVSDVAEIRSSIAKLSNRTTDSYRELDRAHRDATGKGFDERPLT